MEVLYVRHEDLCTMNGRMYDVLKVHKRENFLGSDFEICTFSLLVMHKS